jgi:hypothetical protein
MVCPFFVINLLGMTILGIDVGRKRKGFQAVAPRADLLRIIGRPHFHSKYKHIYLWINVYEHVARVHLA